MSAPTNRPVTNRPAASPEDARRIRERYPRSRLRGPLGLLVFGVLVAAVLGWTIWAGVRGATKPVDAQVHSFQARNDNLVHVEVDIQRRHLDRGASCQVVAAGKSGVPVGQATASVGPGGGSMQSTDIDVRTTGRALSATVGSCQQN